MSVILAVQNLPIVDQEFFPSPKINIFGGKIRLNLFDKLTIQPLFPKFPFQFTLVYHISFYKNTCSPYFLYIWKRSCELIWRCDEQGWNEKEI